jgi:hypothetical protein
MSEKDTTLPAFGPGRSLPTRGGPHGNPQVRYSEAVTRKICERLARGERWSKISGADGLPSQTTLYQWTKRYPDFRAAVQEAKRMGADARADMVLAIAEGATPETLSVDRMHISSLKWHVERDDKQLGRQDEPDLGAGRKLIIVVRDFERYTAPDGSTQVRVAPPTATVGGGA